MYIVRQNSGFTLIEVLVSMSLLVIALMGLSSVTVAVIKGNSYSRYSTSASNLATDKLEDLKSQTFAAADLTSGNHSDTGNPLDTIFTRTWAVVDTMNGTKIIMKTITVVVSWALAGQSTRNVTFNTIIANPA